MPKTAKQIAKDRKRNTKGVFTSEDGQTRFDRWSTPGVLGFGLWFRDCKPCVLHSDGRYRPIRLTPKQGEILKQVYELDENENYVHSLCLNIEPRRHGKTVTYALVCMHLFCSRQNFTIQLCGNTENHSRRVQFNLLCKIIRNTPALRLLIPEKHITQTEIKHPKRGNVIQAMSGINTAAAFGDRLNLLWQSDFHASIDLDYFNALQASLLDSENSLCLIDSNVDSIEGHVHALQTEAETDNTIFADHIFYKDLEDYCRKAPEWINRQKARRLERTLLPAEFMRDILSIRSDAVNALFTSEIIEACKSPYQIPAQDIESLTQGRAYRIGAGLDRAKSIFGSATGADNTVLTVILKVASPQHGEPEIFVLDQQVIMPNTSRGVKKAILKAHEKYKLHNITLENYEVADLAPWLDDQRIPYEMVSAHEVNQTISFTEFFRIAKENRFHFPQSLTGLESEMRTFSYTLKSNNKYSFGHSQQKFKDDRVYSCNWAIFSLRDAVMNLYTLGNILCKNKSARRHMCTLMGGDLVLLCSEQCQAFQEVETKFKEFKQYRLDSELTISEFFETKVKLEGAGISQAA